MDGWMDGWIFVCERARTLSLSSVPCLHTCQVGSIKLDLRRNELHFGVLHCSFVFVGDLTVVFVGLCFFGVYVTVQG